MNRKTREYRWLIPAIIVLAGVLISWWQSRVSELSWWHLIGLGLSLEFLALVWLWPKHSPTESASVLMDMLWQEVAIGPISGPDYS